VTCPVALKSWLEAAGITRLWFTECLADAARSRSEEPDDLEATWRSNENCQ
jgi:hypothetical protein